MRKAICKLGFTAALVLVVVTFAQAANWSGTTGNWSVDSNWSTGLELSGYDAANINVAGAVAQITAGNDKALKVPKISEKQKADSEDRIKRLKGIVQKQASLGPTVAKLPLKDVIKIDDQILVSAAAICSTRHGHCITFSGGLILPWPRRLELECQFRDERQRVGPVYSRRRPSINWS